MKIMFNSWPRTILNRASALLFLLMIAAPAVQARLYRWVDENGNSYYSDKVPPEQSRYRREILSKDVRVVGLTDAAKTKEQWVLEKRLGKLKKEQEKIIAKQKSDDRVLLSTFRNEDDLRMTLAGKLQAISAQQKVSQGNLKRLENQHQAQQKKAAVYERNGKKIPKEILAEIQFTEEQIQLAILDINKYVVKKQDVEENFRMKIERFIFLTRSDPDLVKLADESASIDTANALGLYTCTNEAECNSAWTVARSFVQSYSTTGIDVDSKNLILSSDPKQDHQLSLSVSRVTAKNKQPQFFLDIRCRKSSLGEELCASSKARGLRAAFNFYIKSVLTAAQ